MMYFLCYFGLNIYTMPENGSSAPALFNRMNSIYKTYDRNVSNQNISNRLFLVCGGQGVTYCG